MRLLFALIFFSVFILPRGQAQETLPGFSASLKPNGKVLISWKNGYPAINQISIQRSRDSLRNFTTLLTVPDPHVQENGFVDGKASGTKMFYRIFILFPNSKYMFTKSRRAVPEGAEQMVTVTIPVPAEKPPVQNRNTETPAPVTKPAQKPVTPQPSIVSAPTPAKPAEEEYIILPKIDNARIFYMKEPAPLKKPTVNNPGKIIAPTIVVQKTLFVKRRDSVILLISANQVQRFSDSLVKKTKDTLLFVDADTLQINVYVERNIPPKEVYKVSPFVFVKDGNVNIALSDVTHRKYFVAFYETDSTLVMEVKDIRDSELIIDKTNFGHSGWFRFELYEDGKLKEKNRLLLPRE